MCIRDRSLDCLEALCAKYPVEQGIVATVIDLSERVPVSYTHLQRSTGVIDQYGVDLIDDSVVVLTLYKVFGLIAILSRR